MLAQGNAGKVRVGLRLKAGWRGVGKNQIKLLLGFVVIVQPEKDNRVEKPDVIKFGVKDEECAPKRWPPP